MKKKDSTAADTIRIGLSDEDARFIERQRKAVIDTRLEVFRCLKIVALLNQDADFMAEDEKQFLCGLAEKWERMYRPQLLPKKISLKERQAEVVEDVTRKIEEILSGYMPQCQLEVLGKLEARLPIKE
jgi:hypothetical protein